MTDPIIVQYIGFQVKSLVREYTFVAREGTTEPLLYSLSITNEAFISHRARYQDAPEICLLRLRHELDSHANHPPTTSFCVTDVELNDYQHNHSPKARLKRQWADPQR